MRLLIAAVLLACYWPVLTEEYGFADDYPVLLESVTPGKWLQPAMNQLGRPVNGALMERSYRLAGSVARLRWLRWLGVCGIELLALIAYSQAAPRFGPLRAALLSIFVFTLPAFEIDAAWAQMWASPFAAAIVFLSYRVLRFRPVRGGTLRAAAGIAGIALALAIYQPAAMFFWFWAALDCVVHPKRAGLLRVCMLFALACSIYLAGSKLAALTGGRFSITAQPLHRAAWFVTGVLPSALRLHWIDAPGWLPVGVAAAIAGAAAWRRVPPIALLFVPFSFLPNLAANEESMNFRAQIAVAAVAALLLWTALLSLPRLQLAAAFLLAGLGALTGYSNVKRYMAEPNAAEYRDLKAQLRSFDPARHNRILIRIGNRRPGPAPRRNAGEFGVRSADLPPEYHIFQTMTLLALRDLHGTSFHISPMIDAAAYPSPQAAEPSSGAFPVRMN